MSITESDEPPETKEKLKADLKRIYDDRLKRLNYREKTITETRTFFTEIVAKTIRILKRANPKEENKEESTDDFNY